jgi:arylsulfatase A-like enzyme
MVVLLFSWWLSIKNAILDLASPSTESEEAAAPNILLIVADDLGYNDTSAINAEGLATFRRHYADATCTPSRVAIMTGRYPERSGFRPVGAEIPLEFSTIAEQLHSAGYATYLTGKWHAGETRVQAWPQNKGFESWFGFLNQWETSGEVNESRKGKLRPTYHDPMLRKDGGELEQHRGHLTEILTEHTIQKIQELQNQGQPWFLYHAFLAPHQPIQPSPHFAAQYPDTPEGKYTALVAQLDDAVGRILDVVDRERTLVVFVSDNGGTNSERDNNFPFFGRKSEMYEGAFRTPLIISWPGVIPEGKLIDDVVMNVDLYPTLLASAGLAPPGDIDGENLWPLFQHEGAIGARSRSWEVYSANVNTLSYSYLADNGEWRLSNPQGINQTLHHLAESPSGGPDVAEDHPEWVSRFTADFWHEHWRKSLVPVRRQQGSEASRTLYTGFDAMRTPNRHGFSIGLEVGPLPDSLLEETIPGGHVIAGQDSSWELRFKPGLGLEWHIGGAVLKDSHFDPSRCNAVVLTGYYEPKGHLAKREPRSELKIYSSGFIRDGQRDVAMSAVGDMELQSPTYVNHGGAALFSNMMLSSFADSYAPRLRPQFMEFYETAYRDRQLSLADVSMMDAELCKQSVNQTGPRNP